MERFLKMDVDDDSKSTPSSSLNGTATKAEPIKTWVEKYRPSRLDDVVYQLEVISALQHIIKENAMNLPNLLLYGPPGTGKTSTILALCKELFGDQYSHRVLELNASDERGISVVREKVKNFAQQTVSSNKSNVPKIKVVILDECDSMTRDAQSALRRTMEKYTLTTRFCLICNYSARIIDPILSRCTVFRFKPLHHSLEQQTLLNIAKGENIRIDQDALDSLISICDGDLRRSITLLQAAGLITDTDETIQLSTIEEISGHIPRSVIESFINSCRMSRPIKMMHEKVMEIVKNGHSGMQFFTQLQHSVAMADEAVFNDKQKAMICMKIGANDKRLLDGGDEFVQLLDIGATIIQALQINKQKK